MNTDKIYAEQLANEYAPKDTSKVNPRESHFINRSDLLIRNCCFTKVGCISLKLLYRCL